MAYIEGSKIGLGKEGAEMKHSLRIGVAKSPPLGGIVGYRKVTVRERFLRFLLGAKCTITVIVPGDSVKSLSVIEEGGDRLESRPQTDNC